MTCLLIEKHLSTLYSLLYNNLMHSITFTCETSTPMFLSGADGVTPELRAPSIKGALRFWWRAMNGHLSLEELKRREVRVEGRRGRGRAGLKIIKNISPIIRI